MGAVGDARAARFQIPRSLAPKIGFFSPTTPCVGSGLSWALLPDACAGLAEERRSLATACDCLRPITTIIAVTGGCMGVTAVRLT